MSRVPQPVGDTFTMRPVREPTPADYSDDVSETHFQALQKLVEEDANDEEYELVDGPAW